MSQQLPQCASDLDLVTHNFGSKVIVQLLSVVSMALDKTKQCIQENKITQETEEEEEEYGRK